MTEIGARVFAVRNADKAHVYAYGFGIYMGDHPLPEFDEPATPDETARLEAVIRKNDTERPEFDERMASWYRQKVADGLMTQEHCDEVLTRAAQRQAEELAKPMAERVADLRHSLSLNPKIALDRGGVVWGCESWWGEVDGDATKPPTRFVGDREVVYVPAPHPEEN